MARRLVGDILRGSFFLVPVAVAFNDVVGSATTVRGRSMQPTLNPQATGKRNDTVDIIWEDKLSILRNKYERGSIVVFRNPFDPRERMVKRLIALGGDWVRPQDKGLMVFVPKGYCWVEGDNQGISGDSNHFGAIPLALIEAKVTHVVWPPGRIGRLSQDLPRMHDDRIQGW